MSSTTATLPDDAFRSYVSDFLRHVPPAALGISGTARSELEALAGEFYETSQDINMQELVLALHVRYDLVHLGFFEKSALDEILVRVGTARGNPRAGPGGECGTTCIKNPTPSPQTQKAASQIPAAPDEVARDLVGLSSQFSTDLPMPPGLDPKDLGLAEGEGRSVERGDGPGEDYVVGWRTGFLMTPDGPVVVHKQLRH